MSKCANCGESLNAFNERYGLEGTHEFLCKKCKGIIDDCVVDVDTTFFIDINKTLLISKGLTPNGLDHIQKHIDYLQSTGILVDDEAAEDARQESEEEQKALASMLITSGFNFDGYKVIKYSGYISGDDCITMPRDTFWGSNKVSDNLCAALVKIRRQAIRELKQAAYDLGCNAVIGVDFDYMTMAPQHAHALNAEITVYEPYVICVTANGNAVVIEKED